jgi:hypothetical protein
MISESIARELETEPRELRADELDQVSGGIIAVLIGLLLPAVQAPVPAEKTTLGPRG